MTSRIVRADSYVALALMTEASVDAIVCDPPYMLGFMGKAFDNPHDNPADDPAFWRLALRVLKPGGHLLAFGGTRTYHRMASAVEAAGFEVRDMLHWTYGSGFPKSLDVGKAIDKAAGAEREVVGMNPHARPSDGVYDATYGVKGHDPHITAPATPDAARWNGWGTALKPSHEPVVVARKPLSGTVAATVLEWGTGAVNVDGCRVPTGGEAREVKEPTGRTGAIYGAGLEGCRSAGTSTAGRWPPNTLLSHAPGCRLVGTRRVKTGTAVNRNRGEIRPSTVGNVPAKVMHIDAGYADADGLETVAAYDCAPGCPVAEMGRQSGERPVSGAARLGGGRYSQGGTPGGMFGVSGGDPADWPSDTGTAARFFPNFDADPGFLYVAKASRAERNAGTERNAHPTVKPITVMRWLCRLVTPPGGLVLDPFAGSGSTVIAAHLEGFNAIGIEREAEYAEIARARVRWWVEDADEKARAKTVPNAGGKATDWPPERDGKSAPATASLGGGWSGLATRTNNHGEPPPVEQEPLPGLTR